MVSLPESVKLEIACPPCGKKAYQSVARLRRYKHFRCMACGQTVRMPSDGVTHLEAAIAAFENEMAKIEFFVAPKQ